MINKLSRVSLEKSLRGKPLKGDIRKSIGAKSTREAKHVLAKTLAGRSESQRGEIYKELGIKKRGKESLEGIFSKDKAKEPQLSLTEKKAMKKQAELEKRRNIFLSRHSAEEGGTGWEITKSKFAGGEVETRTRTALGADAGTGTAKELSGRSTFTKGKPGFQKTSFAKDVKSANKDKNNLASKISSNKGQGAPPDIGGNRPLGF